MATSPDTRIPTGTAGGLQIEKAKHAMRSGSGPYQVIARVGYLARGLVYVIVGIFALSVAVGSRRRALNFTEALSDLSERPFGRILILAIAVGLVCFALWRLAQGLLDADQLGSRLKAVLHRVVYAFSSIAYISMAVAAARIAFRGDAPSSAQGWAAWALGLPMGSLLLAIFGAGSIAIAAGATVRASRAPAEKPLDLKTTASPWLILIGRAGNAGRAAVFLLIGYFLLTSAYSADVHEVRDMGGALNVLLDQSYGIYLYLSVAAGLVCFGLFEFIEAMFRPVGRPSEQGSGF